MDLPKNKIIFSGVQPSGTLHIGNYLGALKQFVALQENNTAYYCIVDEHAITVPYEPAQLPERVHDAAALYLACGIDPEKSIIFVQSHVGAHTELGWLLGTMTPFGDLKRMTQFKEKSTKQATASLGLFSYPVLMAADILLYKTEVVPVGEDQVQHIELTRSIAKRFNGHYGDILTIPEVFLDKSAARIMSLTDPTKKMSKSDTDKSYIALTDEPDTIRAKIKSAVTETEPVFSFKESGPAVKNLLTIYQALSGEEPEAIEQKFNGRGYKEFKEALAELVVEKLTPIREKYQELRKDDTTLRLILGKGKTKAEQVANDTLRQVKEKMGLI
jgi:tryptophanyl-tRNA synthetase